MLVVLRLEKYSGAWPTSPCLHLTSNSWACIHLHSSPHRICLCFLKAAWIVFPRLYGPFSNSNCASITANCQHKNIFFLGGRNGIPSCQLVLEARYPGNKFTKLDSVYEMEGQRDRETQRDKEEEKYKGEDKEGYKEILGIRQMACEPAHQQICVIQFDWFNHRVVPPSHVRNSESCSKKKVHISLDGYMRWGI